MKNLFLSIVLFVVQFSIYTLRAQSYQVLEGEFSKSTILPKHHFGFYLYDLDSNKAVFGIKEDQHFTPASNTKTYTLYASLKHLGDSIAGIHYVERGDSLLFWGTGDPTFLHPKLDSRKVYDFLKNSNKKLFYVVQETSEPAYRNGWSIEDYQEYYQPEIAPFPIYGNVVKISSNGKGLVALPSYFDKNLGIRERIQRSFWVSRKLNSNQFEMSNLNVPRNYSTNKPFIWSDSLVVQLLQDTLRREVELLTKYDRPDDLKTIYSTSRNIVLREMMLPSDNFLAEHLNMLVSDKIYNGFYTDSLRNYMQNTYYNNFRDTIFLRDGSGLSTYNKITPRNMVDLLMAIKDEIPDENQRFLFFPAGGVDGTLKSAYSLDQGEPFVWAKTGTINSVHCQSGYIVSRSGKKYAFSFLNNNYAVPTSYIRREMVRIITFIRQNY
ncbi:D-alanyl-D-alanine carboxypeptidase [Sphingobacterium bovistauri]|uniref:D-alanyl-D-alanine carboxypeptidase n=1 Tax=Sphingobacterium bovistauri TaxID=2781959 RepID=A0ABS7Z0S5_9SPHI|nr:D-alanyl-D-alanine carboxypeptidase [Sphingobacterium bovistauri]MCA5003769.1 D-alanyl-D-alanine carboxypeptidase [Sphingobacterium bovistauri]